MKKLFTVLAFALIIANINLLAGDRMVFVERFTSWTCPPCASNNPIMEAWLNSLDYDKVVGIAYHMNWPAPGNDGFFLYNPGENTARRNFYGINAIPEARMDGIINVLPPYSNGGLTSFFNTRTNLLSPITIVLTDSTFGDSIRVRARIYTEVLLSNPNVLVHISINERLRHYSSPPGTNGETDFYDVMRRMTNNGTGQAVTLYPGQTVYVERTYYKDPIWETNQVYPMAYVQQGMEIFNAAKRTNNFTLIPISSYKSVQQGQSQNATFQMSIPVVSAGYNSNVNLTAEVDPPTPGITVSFPNGTTISSFPSNFDVLVSSSASVPTGAYRIIVTGTNTNNKVHKTSVSYLVGQNFITVGTNRPNLDFKVDNQTYNGVKLFTFNLGSQHTLTAISPQTIVSTRYVFQNWSNSGDTTQTVTIGTSTTSYIANYKTQFRLITLVTPSGIPVTITGGNLYYDSASTVNFSVSPTALQFNNLTYYFQRWNGTGNGSYNGTNPIGTINSMNNVISEIAVYDTIAPFGIQNLNTGVPKSFALHQNYPNPFNPVTKIKFDIPGHTSGTIKIYDIIGNEVAVLYNGDLAPGYYEAEFNASSYASGVYFYKLDTKDYSNVKRMILVK